MRCDAREIAGHPVGGTLRERWLRLLFDMYGIQASPGRYDRLLPDTALVRIARSSARARRRAARSRSKVLPFRLDVRPSLERGPRKDRDRLIDQTDVDIIDPMPRDPIPSDAPSTLTPEEAPHPEPPVDSPNTGGGGPQPDQSAVPPPADGDIGSSAGDDLH